MLQKRQKKDLRDCKIWYNIFPLIIISCDLNRRCDEAEKDSRHSKYVAGLLSCLIALSTFTPLTGQARATYELHAIGHIFASEGAKLRLPSGDWVNLGKASVPLFSASLIKTEKGSVYINLAGAGIIEAPRDSEFHIARTEEGITLNLQKGGTSFSTSGPSQFFRNHSYCHNKRGLSNRFLEFSGFKPGDGRGCRYE